MSNNRYFEDASEEKSFWESFGYQDNVICMSCQEYSCTCQWSDNHG